MYIEKVLHDKELNLSHKVFYMLLELHAKNGVVYAGEHRLEQVSGISRKTIRGAAAKLEQRGHIAIKIGADGRKAYKVGGEKFTRPFRRKTQDAMTIPTSESRRGFGNSCIDGLCVCPKCQHIVDVERDWVGISESARVTECA